VSCAAFTALFKDDYMRLPGLLGEVAATSFEEGLRFFLAKRRRLREMTEEEGG